MTAGLGLFHRRGPPESAGESLLRIVGVRLELQCRPILDGLGPGLPAGAKAVVRQQCGVPEKPCSANKKFRNLIP
jgi:hypothetical protein